jgi:hypothetical protein
MTIQQIIWILAITIYMNLDIQLWRFLYQFVTYIMSVHIGKGLPTYCGCWATSIGRLGALKRALRIS